MLDDILEFILEILLELIPTIVWKTLLFVIAIVITAVGVTILTESTLTGGGLVIVGVSLGIGSLISIYR
jgi:hypothetical protein